MMRAPGETNPGSRQENLIVTSVMCIKIIQREEGREKKEWWWRWWVGGRLLLCKLSFQSLQEPQA